MFVAEAPAADVEAAAIADALHVTLSDGLGLVDGLAVTPRLLPDQRWPQLFQLAARGGRRRGRRRPRRRDRRSASPGGSATAIGDSAVAVIDGRQATWTTGANGAIGGAWLVVDTFADGDAVAP